MKSTKTRQDIERELGALTLLWVTAVELISKDKRPEKMISELKRAFQLFKENRLHLVLSGTTNLVLNSEVTRVILSQEVNEIGFDPQVVKYLHSNGILYVGEIYGREYDMRKAKGKEKSPHILKNQLLEMGLPFENFNPFNIGWEPPYWQEDWFQEQIVKVIFPDAKIGDCEHRIGFQFAKIGIYFPGQILRKASKRGCPKNLPLPHHSFYHHNARNALKGTNLREGMFIPSDWKTPLPPKEWEDFVASCRKH